MAANRTTFCIQKSLFQGISMEHCLTRFGISTKSMHLIVSSKAVYCLPEHMALDSGPVFAGI